jgi:CBS domain-containing protein
MVANVRACFMTDSLTTATRLMWDHDCGCAPVLNENAQIVGMLTDRDICMAAYFQDVPLSEIRVWTAMSSQLFVCNSDDDLSAAEGIMREKKVRRLPAVDQQGRLVGLISVSDIARHAEREHMRGAADRNITDAEVARLTAAVSEPR